MRLSGWNLAVAASLAAAGCSGGNGNGGNGAGTDAGPVAQQSVTAAAGGTVTVSSAQDENLAGVSVTIPAGALAQDTTITVTEGAPLSLPAGSKSVTPVVDLGPAGTKFAKPVTITLPFLAGEANTSDLSAVGVEADGTTTVYAGSALTVGATTLAFNVSGFTRFGGVSGPPCPNGNACTGCNGTETCPPAAGVCPTQPCQSSSSGGGSSGSSSSGSSSSGNSGSSSSGSSSSGSSSSGSSSGGSTTSSGGTTSAGCIGCQKDSDCPNHQFCLSFQNATDGQDWTGPLSFCATITTGTCPSGTTTQDVGSSQFCGVSCTGGGQPSGCASAIVLPDGGMGGWNAGYCVSVGTYPSFCAVCTQQ